LVKRRHRRGVAGRIDAKGDEVVPLDPAAVLAAAQDLASAGVQSLAISFLHAYRNPAHEAAAAAIVRHACPGLTVSVSSEITREYREYERTATTVLDAYIRPIFEAYVEELEDALKTSGFSGNFLIMRSSSGAMTAATAREAPIFTVLSGPAGGIVGAASLARTLQRPRLLTLDYGGTSLDASVIEDGQPLVMHEAMLENFPVLIPIFDIRCIGAGGGSIAWVQEGLLQVGPQSAGAEPGPIAYGKGGREPTTTDAALILGYLDADAFLDGAMPLDATAAAAGMQSRIASCLGVDVVQASAGIFEVLVAKTVSAIREITVERGKDPREFSLLAFGGAGPMIAPLLAREIDNFELIIPNAPAAFSASGMLLSDLVSDQARTEIRPLAGTDESDIETVFRDLERKACASLERQGVAGDRQTVQRLGECRYAGQEHTLEVDFSGEISAVVLRQAFDRLHHQRYGHAMTDPVQIVTLRVRAVARLTKADPPRLPPASGRADQAMVGRRPAYCFATRQMLPFALYRRHRLQAGHRLDGPAIIDEGNSTTIIHSDQQLEIDPFGHLIITRRRS
jgi:N-methylhydantoinase A